MTRISDIQQGKVELTIPDNPQDILAVQSIPYEIIRTSENFKHVLADGIMTEKDLLAACGYKAGYVLFEQPYDGKFIYEVRRGILRLD